MYFSLRFQALLAQWIARWTSNPKVVGSSPTQGIFFECNSFYHERIVFTVKECTVHVIILWSFHIDHVMLKENDVIVTS